MNKLIMFTLILGLFSCKNTSNLSTVKELDVERYTGVWYEIARLPNNFEKGLKCITAEYSLKENGKIKVVNSGYKISDESAQEKAVGKAWIPDKDFPGRLKVSFFWPFSGDYFIIHLDEQYKHVLVGSPSRKYLWILAREKNISDEIKNKLIKIAKDKNFDTDKLIWVEQDCEN